MRKACCSASLVRAWMLIGMLLAAACVGQQAENLVVNPGFEAGLDGWEVVNPDGVGAG